MKLILKGNEDLENFNVQINKEKKQFNNTQNLFEYEVEFDLVQNKEYEVVINELLDENILTFKHIMLLVIFWPIILVINYLQIDYTAWWKKIKPVCITIKFKYKNNKDEIIELKYNSSHYKKSTKKWTLPKISLNVNKELDTSYRVNSYSFRNEFINSCFEIISSFCLLLIVAIVLLYFSLKGKIDLLVISIISIVFIILIPVFILYFQYKKMKKIQSLFFK